MTREEINSCIRTLEMMKHLVYNVDGVMDVVDKENCDKIIEALEKDVFKTTVRKIRIIDANALITDFWAPSYTNREPCKEYVSMEQINRASTLELELKVGKWVDHSDDGYVECPFCGSATNCDDNVNELHYCFSCGARMEMEVKG